MTETERQIWIAAFAACDKTVDERIASAWRAVAASRAIAVSTSIEVRQHQLVHGYVSESDTAEAIDFADEVYDSIDIELQQKLRQA